MSFYMKIYPTDPLVQLLSLLWFRADGKLVKLLNAVAHQFYMMPCSVVAQTYQRIIGCRPDLREAA